MLISGHLRYHDHPCVHVSIRRQGFRSTNDWNGSEPVHHGPEPLRLPLTRQNRPSRRERKVKELKTSLKPMCKKAARDGESLHERTQLSHQWRNATKANRKLGIERELNEKARK